MKDKNKLFVDLNKEFMKTLGSWIERHSLEDEDAETYASVIVNSLTLILGETFGLLCNDKQKFEELAKSLHDNLVNIYDYRNQINKMMDI